MSHAPPRAARLVRLTTLPLLLLAAACGASDGDAPVASADACAPSMPLALAPGEARYLAVLDSACLSLASAGDYAVAYVDVREIDRERTYAGPAGDPDPPYAIEIGRPAQLGAALHAASRAPAHASDMVRAMARLAEGECDAALPACRAAPWAEGDTLTVRLFGAPDYHAVVSVVEGPLVLASVDPAQAASEAPALRRLAAEALARTVPLLRRTFRDRQVVSSAASAQLLVLLTGENISLATPTLSDTGATGWIRLSLARGAIADSVGFAAALRLLSHELTHLWQFDFRAAELAGAPWPDPRRWAMEGGADLVADEVLRVRAGLALEGNEVPLSTGQVASTRDLYLRFVNLSHGDIGTGYQHSEPFLRDLLIRGVAAGRSYDEALAAVSRGTTGSWWGRDGEAAADPGMAGRAGALLGETGRDPAEWLLRWASSTAADDRAPGTALQNPAVLEAWQPRGLSGWPADAAIDIDHRATITRDAEAAGYALVAIDASSVARPLRLRSRTPGAVAWMMSRIR